MLCWRWTEFCFVLNPVMTIQVIDNMWKVHERNYVKLLKSCTSLPCHLCAAKSILKNCWLQYLLHIRKNHYIPATSSHTNLLITGKPLRPKDFSSTCKNPQLWLTWETIKAIWEPLRSLIGFDTNNHLNILKLLLKTPTTSSINPLPLSSDCCSPT